MCCVFPSHPLDTAGLHNQLAKDLPRCNVVCCVENKTAADTHRSQLIIMLAGREASLCGLLPATESDSRPV